jgi:hypothetical protein
MRRFLFWCALGAAPAAGFNVNGNRAAPLAARAPRRAAPMSYSPHADDEILFPAFDGGADDVRGFFDRGDDDAYRAHVAVPPPPAQDADAEAYFDPWNPFAPETPR